ncbi:2346_t:CDS:1, partial [Acaulospora colombiana]
SSIGVYGTVSQHSQTRSQYQLDTQSPIIYNITVDRTVDWGDHNQLYAVPFYESPELEYGEHQLDVTVDRQWTPQWKRFIFDFLTIRVKNDTTDSNHFMVDESDPIVRYTGNWEKEASAKYNYKGTTHKASSSGCVSILPFSGNAIEVYGAFRSSSNDSASIISFQIDDGPKYNFDSFNTQGKIHPAVRLFSRAGITEGQHTLRMESLSRTEVWLDYFMYKSSPPDNGFSNTSPSSTSTSPSQKSNTAAIAGGVVGGIAGLALLILLLLLYRRKRRDPAIKEGKNDKTGASTGYEAASKPPY